LTGLEIRQLTDVSQCNLQQHLCCNRHRDLHSLRGLPRRAAAQPADLPDQLSPSLLRNPMNVMAPTRPTALHLHRVRLSTGPVAAAEARSQVREAIRNWEVPVDPDVAILLTSELVTNAIRHETSASVMLTISCSCDQLRVDVHDTSRALPVAVDAAGDAETGRGLLLVATLATEWGFYRTPAGKAVHFTLAALPPSLPDAPAIPPARSPRRDRTQHRFPGDVRP
jgi:anti-sigma regulatory factor (Ser/Thr protein kinase)